MIWTVTANPAVDITYRVDHVDLGEVHRIHVVTERPGGKGLNVACTLDSLGEQVCATGFLGGANGQQVEDLLTVTHPNVLHRFVPVQTQTRRSVAIVDAAGRATVFNEAGTPREEADWERLRIVLGEVHAGDVVAISGSMPPHTDEHVLPDLIKQVKSAGASVLVDTSGPALLLAARAGADMLKPNREELLEATGASTLSEGVRRLLDMGAGMVALSMGKDGMTAAGLDEDGTMVALHSVSNRDVTGNPTGAGDASVAAWCQVFADPTITTVRQRLAGVGEAVAVSTAAVASLVAGEFDAEELAIQRGPKIEELTHDW